MANVKIKIRDGLIDRLRTLSGITSDEAFARAIGTSRRIRPRPLRNRRLGIHRNGRRRVMRAGNRRRRQVESWEKMTAIIRPARVTVPSSSTAGDVSRTVHFWMRSRRYSAALNVLRAGEADFIAVNVNEPVDATLTRVEELHKQVVVGLIKMLRECGLGTYRKDDVHLRLEAYPQRGFMVDSKLKGYSVFLDLGQALEEERVSPRVQLASVTINFQKPRFAHVRRVLRRRKVRRFMKKDLAGTAGGSRNARQP